jgi:CheY-like chemotaxis protein
MDGYQVARSLKQLETCQQTTLIAVTGSGETEDRERSRQAGIDHHVVKPIDFGVLLDLLGPDQTSAAQTGQGQPTEEPPHGPVNRGDAGGFQSPPERVP